MEVSEEIHVPTFLSLKTEHVSHWIGRTVNPRDSLDFSVSSRIIAINPILNDKVFIYTGIILYIAQLSNGVSVM